MFRNPCVKRTPPRSTKDLVSVQQAYWNTECGTKHEVPPGERRMGSESDPSAAAGLGPVRGLSTRGQSGLQGGGASQAFAAWEAHFRAQASESEGLGRNPTSAIVEKSSHL